MKKTLCVIVAMTIVILLCSCGEDKTQQAAQNSGVQQQAASSGAEAPTEPQVLDITLAYNSFPYSNDFAIGRKTELKAVNDLTLYHVSSSKSLPQFYKNFFNERGKYNVTFDKYSYDTDRNTVKEYFDAWEYKRFANWGTTKVIDSFVIEDDGSLTYYSFYTSTVLGDGEDSDRVSYYYDCAAIDKTTLSITKQENIPVRENLTVPKSISGDNDFSNVI
ncbi:MAG TPA: hypothetical protein GX401_04205 [Clostridiales bacterium]|nr:hypothetical protein [Clostridiales bacterium]